MPDPGHRRPPWTDGGRPPGWGPARHFFRRLIGFVFVLFLAGTVIGGFIMNRFARFGPNGGHRWIFAGLIMSALIVVGLLAIRRFGRSWAPVGELIDATRRLGEGESEVRIQTMAPGPFGAIGASFNRMAVRLEEEDERRRRLLADLGHELRTPLTVIRGEIEAVIDGLHPPEDLSNVVDEVDLMERLLEDLRVLALTEAGRLQLHKEALNVEGLIGDVITSFAAHMQTQRVEAVVDVPPGMADLVADPLRLHQVLGNLISNALRQMPDGGVLTVSARRVGEAVVIEVADTGPGIPEDRRRQIFDRFVKAGDSAGTGLGLSIARDLVEAHGGTISASNRPEGGALFTVTVPA